MRVFITGFSTLARFLHGQNAEIAESRPVVGVSFSVPARGNGKMEIALCGKIAFAHFLPFFRGLQPKVSRCFPAGDDQPQPEHIVPMTR